MALNEADCQAVLMTEWITCMGRMQALSLIICIENFHSPSALMVMNVVINIPVARAHYT